MFLRSENSFIYFLPGGPNSGTLVTCSSPAASPHPPCPPVRKNCSQEHKYDSERHKKQANAIQSSGNHRAQTHSNRIPNVSKTRANHTRKSRKSKAKVQANTVQNLVQTSKRHANRDLNTSKHHIQTNANITKPIPKRILAHASNTPKWIYLESDEKQIRVV